MIYSAQKRFEEADVFGKSTEGKAFAQYFIGNSYLNPKTDARCGLFLANVTFERAAEATGTSTTQEKAADRSSSAQPARAGTKRKGNPPSA